MEFRLSKPRPSIEDDIVTLARLAGCIALITRATAQTVRFTLMARAGSSKQASYRQHDTVIQALLKLDPEATVRTAMAIYHGLDDFERQAKAQGVAL